jgi:hypothetical protein
LHGTTYFNLKNDALNANTLHNNAYGIARSPLKEDQYGFQVGGPVWGQKLFFSAGLGFRGYDLPQDVNVPSPLAALKQALPGGAAYTLLTEFPTPATDPGNGKVTPLRNIRPTVSVNRYLGLARADYVSGARHFILRIAFSRFDRPDFIWNPYRQFTSSLDQPFSRVALGYSDSIGAALMQDLHAGWSRNTIQWNRPFRDVPTLVVQDPSVYPLYLPGSQLLYGLRDTDRNYQINDSWSWLHGNHIVKFCGGILLRSLDSIITIGRDAEVTFAGVNSFYFDEPNGYSAAVGRTSAPLQQPAYGRNYRNTQFFFFGEDTWKVGRLSLNLGLRYENFGAPTNTGAVKDTLAQLGNGTSFPGHIHTAKLVTPGPGDQKLWVSDNTSFAPRFGFSWGPGGDALLVRGGMSCSTGGAPSMAKRSAIAVRGLVEAQGRAIKFRRSRATSWR